MTPNPPRRHRWLAGLTLVGLAAFAGCGSDDDGTDAGNGEGTVEQASGDGAALYEASCASCHGSDLRGTDQGPSHLSIVYEPGHHSDDAFRAAVTQGSPAHHWEFGDMPPVPDLEPAEVEAIIAFIRAQQEEHGFEPYPPE